MEIENKRILVTSALPYANGPLHIGHLAGCYLPADIYVRYQKAKGRDVIHICGTDEHGVQITLKAEEEGISPKELVDRYYRIISKALTDLGIYYDNFSRTTKEIHYRTSQEFFLKLKDNGYFIEKEMEQLYCSSCKKFLPDRFVEGICPHCKTEGARGDQCEACGRWIEPTELIEARCRICANKPVLKKTKHWFLQLDKLSGKLQKWQKLHEDWKDNVKNFCKNWFDEGLHPRAITRDIKWGVPVPVEGYQDKVLYVWFDAPIGYISSTKEWAEKKKKDKDLWKQYWMGKNTKLVHFIGKDNIVFHAIVWPGMLMGNGEFILPDEIPANEFLNIDSKKTSTSRNWAVWVDEVLKDFPPDVLRYVIAANPPENSDVDFTWKEFQRRTNDELADIFGNLVNRALTFIHKYYCGMIPEYNIAYFDKDLTTAIEEIPDKVGELFEGYHVRKAVSEIIKLAKTGNRIFQENEPWKTRKTDPLRCKTIIVQCIVLIDTLATICEPVMPFTSDKILKMLDLEKRPWDQASSVRIAEGHKISKVKILFNKIDDDMIDKQIEKLGKQRNDVAVEDFARISDIEKLKLTVGQVISIEKAPKSDKLYKICVDLGEEKRDIVAGLVPFYSEEDLLGKKIVLVSNLKPAEIRGIRSKGMLLAADKEGVVSVLTVDKDIPVGAKIR